MRQMLLDTGPLVSLIDSSEKIHSACSLFAKGFSGQFLTTEPVLTEALYLLNESFSYQKKMMQFVVKGGIQIIPTSQKALQKSFDMMEKYQDIPMDFADATLVVLAEEADMNEIFTLDHRGFNTYRIHNKKSFVIYP